MDYYLLGILARLLLLHTSFIIITRSGLCWAKLGSFTTSIIFVFPPYKLHNIIFKSTYHDFIPVKNVTEILMEIPCHFSSQIEGSLSSKLAPNPMTIPCHLSRFSLLSMLKHDMILDKFKSWNVHGIC